MQLRISSRAAACCLALVLAIGGPAHAGSLSQLVGAAKNSGNALFGSTEFRSNSLSALPQWTRILRVMAEEGPQFRRCANDPGQCTTPQLKSWRKIIVQASQLPRPQQLKAVNQFFNRWPYKYDLEAYQRREYWATPREFMTRSGDCEDYAIAKFFALRQLGFGNDELRIVVLWDEIRGLGHAVLVHYTASDILVLDSLSSFIVSHQRFRHYIPQVSMNETSRWAHVTGGKQIPSIANRN